MKRKLDKIEPGFYAHYTVDKEMPYEYSFISGTKKGNYYCKTEYSILLWTYRQWTCIDTNVFFYTKSNPTDWGGYSIKLDNNPLGLLVVFEAALSFLIYNSSLKQCECCE